MPEPALSDLEQTRDARRAYWRANVRIVLTLLAVWLALEHRRATG